MADQWYASGSRLKLQYYEATDGAKQFVGWRDSMRMDDCSFGPHADGSTRCLPASTLIGVFFAAGCTTALAYVPKSSPAPKYGAKYEAPGTRVYSIAGVHAGAVYTGTPAACSATTAFDATYNFFDAGAEVLASDFVQATKKTAP